MAGTETPETEALKHDWFVACSNLALTPESEFTGVYRFIPASCAPRQLAMEALFRSLRDIPLSVSDPSVGVAKLGWWHKELGEARERGSQHPVVQALLATGAMDTVSTEEFNSYLHALMLSLQDERMGNVTELETWLRNTAGREARLLAGEGDSPGISLEELGSAARLLELIRTLSRQQTEHNWLPMDLVARHAASGKESDREQARRAMVVDLAELALGWSQPEPSLAQGPGESLVVLRNRLVAHRLRRAVKHPQNILDGEVKGRFSDVFTVWRRARQLMRSDAWQAPGANQAAQSGAAPDAAPRLNDEIDEHV